MFDLGLNVHLNRVDAIFFSFTCAAVPKLKTKIYLSFLFSLLSIFMFGFFFAQSLQSVILCVLFVNMFLLFCFILAL